MTGKDISSAMSVLAELQKEEAREAALRDDLLAQFEAAGAQHISVPSLQPAAELLDLYGEDIRARAYVTHDPVMGEQMLRPDFTLPIVQMHMQHRLEPARYCYAGTIWRKQPAGSLRPHEYTQVGYEIFDRQSPLAADAALFALFARVLAPYGLNVTTGDLGLLRAAIQGLSTSEARKAALLRHIWRPKRFVRLLERFSGNAPPNSAREALLARFKSEGLDAILAEHGPEIGLRDRQAVAARITLLAEEAETPPLAREERALLEEILALRGRSGDILPRLREICADFPQLTLAVTRFARRLDELKAHGVDADTLPFEGSYGRTTLEYYDGFVFGFATDQTYIATGGRYDALCAVLGKEAPGGVSHAAIGGVIRPDLLARIEEKAGLSGRGQS